MEITNEQANDLFNAWMNKGVNYTRFGSPTYREREIAVHFLMANLAGMEPRCPKCGGVITWEKDDKFAVCNRAHKTDKGIIFHQFENQPSTGKRYHARCEHLAAPVVSTAAPEPPGGLNCLKCGKLIRKTSWIPALLGECDCENSPKAVAPESYKPAEGPEEILATIYLTQWHGRAQDFVAVTGCFALFLLLPVRHYAKRAGTGYASATNTDAALTTNHLPLKGDSWLLTSVHVPARDANLLSQRSKGRSLKTWNSGPRKTDIPSASCSKIELSSASMSNRTLPFSLSYPTGKPTITNRLNAGELFTANDFSNIKPKPAFIGRVFSFGLASRSSPEEYGGEQLADCGGASW